MSAESNKSSELYRIGCRHKDVFVACRILSSTDILVHGDQYGSIPAVGRGMPFAWRPVPKDGLGYGASSFIVVRRPVFQKNLEITGRTSYWTGSHQGGRWTSMQEDPGKKKADPAKDPWSIKDCPTSRLRLACLENLHVDGPHRLLHDFEMMICDDQFGVIENGSFRWQKISSHDLWHKTSVNYVSLTVRRRHLQ